MALAMVLVAVNVVAGALLYLDVVRSGHSGWWLFLFWLFGPVAIPAYLFVRVRVDGRAARRG